MTLVSFKTAVLLENKGWDTCTDIVYTDTGERFNVCDKPYTGFLYYAPYQSQVKSWLKRKKIIIVASPAAFNVDGECISWNYTIWAGDNCEKDEVGNYLTEEDAVESAIQYALKNILC